MKKRCTEERWRRVARFRMGNEMREASIGKTGKKNYAGYVGGR